MTLLLVLTGTYKVILLQDSVLSHGQTQCLEKHLEPTREQSADQEARKQSKRMRCMAKPTGNKWQV